MASGNSGKEMRAMFLFGLVLLLLTEVLALGGMAPAPHSLLSVDPNLHSPFFAYAVAGMFALHAVAYGKLPQVVAALGIGIILATLHLALFQSSGMHWLRTTSVVCYYLGTGSLVMLTWQAMRSRATPAGHASINTLRDGMLLPLFVIISWSWLEATTTFSPRTFDATLYRFDQSLGVQASAVVAQWFEEFPPLAAAASFIYAALPLFAALIHGLQVRSGGVPPKVLPAFLIVAVAGFAIYFVFPAAGPRYLLGDLFPHHLPVPESFPANTSALPPAYRNAMPSLHMAWALVLWFNVRNLSWPLRAGAAGIAFGTALATLGLGEHYLIDLVVAFPLALVAQAMCSPGSSMQATRAKGVGVVLLAGWLVYLVAGVSLFERMGAFHWGMIVATVVATLLPIGGLSASVTAREISLRPRQR